MASSSGGTAQFVAEYLGLNRRQLERLSTSLCTKLYLTRQYDTPKDLALEPFKLTLERVNAPRLRLDLQMLGGDGLLWRRLLRFTRL